MYIAVDIGGTKTLVAAYSVDGEILRSDKHPTEKDFDKFIENLCREVGRVAGDEKIDAIAIAAPALIDYDAGIARSFGNLDWTNVDIVTPVKARFHAPVAIDNDANMGALGEANMGAGVDHEKVLYVTLSTGIGTGVTMGGKLSPALRKSEGGMMRFRHDDKLVIWERFASGSAFVDEFGQYGADDENPEDWKAWAEDVSIGMVDMISIIQPDAVVIGGSMGNHIAKYQDFLIAAIDEKRGQTVDMPQIIQAQDPDNAVINGCYVVCKQQSED